MIKSMTGYGSAYREFDKFFVKVEVKSLNSKFFDFKVRLPNKYIIKEIELQKYLENKLVRGKIDLIVGVRFLDPTDIKKSINIDLLKSYYADMDELSKSLNISNQNALDILLSMPDAMSPVFNTDTVDETEWEMILEVINEAILKFDKFRNNEGEQLKKELLHYSDSILHYVNKIDETKDNRIEKLRERIHVKLEELKAENVDKERFEQELVYYLEKLDITEEIERLKTHINYFSKSIDEDNNGKKLGFIAQEIGREINTIGSKANNSDIQHSVVLMKNELEKIKQQLSNIL